MRTMNRAPAWLLLALALGGATAVTLPAAEPTRHPFILWTREEAAAIRRRIETQAWAKKEYESHFRPGAAPASRRSIDNLFMYLVMGDRSVIEHEKARLRAFIGCPTYVKDDFDWQWHHVDHYQHALRYDVLYDELSEGERKNVYQTLRRLSLYGILPPQGREEGGEHLRTLEGYERMASHHVCAVATGDARIVEGMATTGGGFGSYLDSLDDGHFLRPAGVSGLRNLGHLMLWCRGCEHLGLDQFGYGYKGKQGGTMRGLLEAFIRLGDPRLTPPGGTPFYTCSAVKTTYLFHSQPELLREFSSRALLMPAVMGHFRDGAGGWSRWSQDGSPEVANVTFETGEARMHLPLLLELAHKKWPDAGFGYLLAQMRGPQDDKYYPSLYWDLDPIDPAQVRPPEMKSVLYPQHGLALLRAEEGPGFWESPAPAAAFRLATGTGLREVLSLSSFFAYNRPLYLVPVPGRGPLQWSRCGLDVDGLLHTTHTAENTQQTVIAWPHPLGQVPVRAAFLPLVKFAAARANQTVQSVGRDDSGRPVPYSAEVFPGVEEERALFLTREYLLDVLRAASSQPHTYRWIVNAVGQAQPERADGWKESEDLHQAWPPRAVDDRGGGVWSIQGERACPMEDRDWSVTATQIASTEGAKGRLGDEWFARKVGVRMTMLGEAGTTAYLAFPAVVRREGGGGSVPGPRGRQPLVPLRTKNYDFADQALTEIPDAPPEPPQKVEEQEKAPPPPPPKPEVTKCDDWSTIVAARRGTRTTFVALHEPFEGGAPKLVQFRRVHQSDDAVAVAVAGPSGSPVNDRLFLRLGDGTDQPLKISDGEDAFTFSDWAYLRIGSEKVEAAGKLTGLKLKVQGSPKLFINGKEELAGLKDGCLLWGQ